MKIAILSEGPTLESNVEERFNRWPYFLIIDTDTFALESIRNHDIVPANAPQRARAFAEKGVSFLLTGNCGSTSVKIFEEAGIQVITGLYGRVRDVIEHFSACFNPFPIFQFHK
jgi:predicted Fe-Mo cluster-binding NifX family protein